MCAQEETARVLRNFYERKTDRLNVYLPGIGALFVARTTDGISIGYLEKNKRFGYDDHTTIIFDLQGIKGIHRTVSDNSSVVYMKPNIEYIIHNNGARSVLQEIEQQGKMPFPAKAIWMMIFRTLNWASDSGNKISKNVTTLTEEQANELGVKSPCLYIKPELSQSLIIPLFNVLIRFQSYGYSRMFGKRITAGFIPGAFPGLKTTKYIKEDRKRVNKRANKTTKG